MVVGFTTTYPISAYHLWCCEFESPSGQGVQHYVISLSVTCDRSVVFCRSFPRIDTGNQDIQDIQGSRVGSRTTISFKRPLTTNDNDDFQFTETNCAYFMYICL
jgi:hypothetical protein